MTITIIFLLVILERGYSYIIEKSNIKNQQRFSLPLYCYNFYNSNNILYSNAFNSNNYHSYKNIKSYKSSNLFITQVHYSSYTLSKYSFSYPLSFQTFGPTLEPTFITTLKPTLASGIISSLKFETSITLSGFSQNTLDDNSLLAIIYSIAYSANISSNYVSIKEYTFINGRRRLLTFTLKNLYSLLLVSEIIVPINNNIANPSSHYLSLTTTIQNSISSGSFIIYLLERAALLNASISSNNISVSNYTISQMSIINSNPTLYPTSVKYGESTKNLSNIYVVKIIFISMAALIVFLFVFMLIGKKYNNYVINYAINNTINHQDIQVSV